MVYCPCCREDVSSNKRRSHLNGGGPQHVKIHQQVVNLTSRIYDKFKKRKKTKDDSSSESDTGPLSKAARHDASESPVPSPDRHFTPPLEHEYDAGMNLDPAVDPPVHIGPRVLPTTRTRMVDVDEDSEHESESDESKTDLVFVDSDADTDTELDEDLLRRRELTASEVLEGEFETEELHRAQRLTPAAMDAIRAHNLKVDIDLGARAYAKTRRAFPQLKDLPTLCQLQSEITFLSGIKPVKYDCCKKSCCCFVGPYAELSFCPHCNQPRYNSNGRPRATFEYLPLIPRLKALFADKAMCEELLYRARYEPEPGKISDIFDSLHYRRLRGRRVSVDDEVFRHFFFDQITDLAIGLSTDGVCPFKNRTSTCWPLLGIIYNLKPALRFLLDHVICLGVIPGPSAPKDLDSFLIPLRDEFWKLARGVAAFNALREQSFILRAYLIRVFGDMPAMAKLMRMKGPNGIFPCRACKIRGMRDEAAGARTNYVPLHRPGGNSYDPLDLPRRTHDDFIDEAVHVELAAPGAELERRSKETGINGLPILATLSSIRFPESFGHDLMHLIPENVVKNLIKLWTGAFKDFDVGNNDYELQPTVVDAIGSACAAAGDTTPAAFGARVPNLATQMHYFTAESYTLWTTLLGPVLLRNRFANAKYYKHFINLVRIFNDCLKLSIDRDYVDNELRARIAEWVQVYEKIYYQYKPGRLPTCTLTIHALLHIADDILNSGPMWCYWNYVTERFVGYLVRSSKSRKHPYASFARRLREIAQNSVIKTKYHLSRELDLSDRVEEELKGHGIPEYPDIRLLRPHARGPVDVHVRKAIKNFVLKTYEVPVDNADEYIPAIVSHWGRISFLNGGDLIRAADLVHATENNITRDATFIKYFHDVDKNERRPRMPVVFERRVAYGQLLRIIEFFADLPPALDGDEPEPQAQKLILAVIHPVKPKWKNNVAMPYYQDTQAGYGPLEVIDADDISCLVARVPDHAPGPRVWALCERQDAMGVADEDL